MPCRREQEEREARKEAGLPLPGEEAPFGGRGSHDVGDQSTTNLFIGNLAPDVDEQVGASCLPPAGWCVAPARPRLPLLNWVNKVVQKSAGRIPRPDAACAAGTSLLLCGHLTAAGYLTAALHPNHPCLLRALVYAAFAAALAPHR